ncbi:DUF1048 domain-containing protein [uncultured Pseudokineococcus sp.]|uniref:DUF1048 domain-containing protein n=1 Tax=uncultured Pseudokineococcus sp. TaxID=1642928 RepID=UPI00260AB7E2|nr:DUF1048 domain-containing protein [uncultured Pseudokineococcus sp.]
MRDFITKLVGDKREWRAMEARAAALPQDYRLLYAEIQKYLWRLSSGDGRGTIEVLAGLLDLFEAGAADGRRALEVTGPDVAGFCDGLLLQTRTYTQDWREELNRTVHDTLAEPPRDGSGRS